MQNLKLHIISLFVVLAFLACQNDQQFGNVEVLEIPVQIVLPADNMSNFNKVMGDPGTTETFRLPRYAYFFLVIDWEDGSSSTIYTKTQTIESEQWKLSTYHGNLYTEGDNIYTYDGSISFTLSSKERSAGRLYAAASYMPLSLSDVNPATESDILNITFPLTSELRVNVQDIYSTPCYYKPDGVTYYGTISDIKRKVPTAYALLYHVASKVDVIWNVQESLQRDMRVTDLKATHLYDGDCYLFRPTDNTVSTDTYGSGYDMQLTSDNIGTQWEGRSYFYAIPYTNNAGKCPLQLEVQANGNTTGSYKTTVLNDPSSPFVPWLRGTISISRNVETLYN